MRTLFDMTGDGPVIRVHVQPGARRSAVVGVHGDALKVKVAAPALSGRANAALLELLADALGVPARALEITAGLRGRAKRVAVTGLDAVELRDRIETALSRTRPV